MTTPFLSYNLVLVAGKIPEQTKIKINEKETSVLTGTTLFYLKNQFQPDADVVIYNGFPATSDLPLKEGDEIVFIKKGEIPSPEEFECLMMARHTPGIHQKIRKSVVGIAGLGGLGSAVAIALARIGVGRLILVDFDVVEPSNLNRQQYFIHQIGMPKVEALQENLSKINPYVRVQTYNEKLDRKNVEKIFEEAEVVVEAFDRADEKAMLINTVSEKMPDKYIVAASGVAGYGENNEIKTVRFSSRIFIVGDHKTAAQPGVGLMAPRVGIVAHHQANVVLRVLLGEEK
ncbi:MAG TPA: sulfur carrier protein ThiS adenylyltransferase ThiF [Thermodesulfobacteriota bacterium]|nr:sulfur carrier protein ThiS adenylyltransferase ThiF [Thermodesulfobacteriota bacterium]